MCFFNLKFHFVSLKKWICKENETVGTKRAVNFLTTNTIITDGSSHREDQEEQGGEEQENDGRDRELTYSVNEDNNRNAHTTTKTMRQQTEGWWRTAVLHEHECNRLTWKNTHMSDEGFMCEATEVAFGNNVSIFAPSFTDCERRGDSERWTRLVPSFNGRTIYLISCVRCFFFSPLLSLTLHVVVEEQQDEEESGQVILWGSFCLVICNRSSSLLVGGRFYFPFFPSSPYCFLSDQIAPVFPLLLLLFSWRWCRIKASLTNCHWQKKQTKGMGRKETQSTLRQMVGQGGRRNKRCIVQSLWFTLTCEPFSFSSFFFFFAHRCLHILRPIIQESTFEEKYRIPEQRPFPLTIRFDCQRKDFRSFTPYQACTWVIGFGTTKEKGFLSNHSHDFFLFPDLYVRSLTGSYCLIPSSSWIRLLPEVNLSRRLRNFLVEGNESLTGCWSLIPFWMEYLANISPLQFPGLRCRPNVLSFRIATGISDTTCPPEFCPWRWQFASGIWLNLTFLHTITITYSDIAWQGHRGSHDEKAIRCLRWCHKRDSMRIMRWTFLFP